MISFGLPRHFYLLLYYCLALFFYLPFCGKKIIKKTFFCRCFWVSLPVVSTKLCFPCFLWLGTCGKGLDIGMNAVKMCILVFSFLRIFCFKKTLPALFRFAVISIFHPTAFHLMRVGSWVTIQNLLNVSSIVCGTYVGLGIKSNSGLYLFSVYKLFSSCVGCILTNFIFDLLCFTIGHRCLCHRLLYSRVDFWTLELCVTLTVINIIYLFQLDKR